MSFRNIRLVLGREIRDQMRDKRTLFMIFVLPVLLYPLLGMSYMQIQQFVHEQKTKVLIVGAKDLPTEPPLFENKQFHTALFNLPEEANKYELTFHPDEPPLDDQPRLDVREMAKLAVQKGEYDVAVYFPEDFDERLDRFRQAIEESVKRAAADRDGSGEDDSTAARVPQTPPQVPSPQIIYTTANERSPIGANRVSSVLNRWTGKIGESNLMAGGVPLSAAKPFELSPDDQAKDSGLAGAAVWAKLFPVLLLIWAMTGAFYPAVDLCAGEKERGTLETLLCSPAERSEIVMGKLLTIMLFSILTAGLNLTTLGVTGWLISSQVPGLSPPPLMAAVWSAIALVPVAALFSALCLAMAAFARSTKEGQYYLMPLLLITMPLAIMPMSSAIELNMGTSLIPVTGIVLLLRNTLEGNYLLALQYLPVVLIITVLCCMLAIRWAVDQFNSESVLFRESEQFSLGLWLRHLWRDRKPTPSVAMALFCGVFILSARFFLGFAFKPATTFQDFALQTTVMVAGVVGLTPIALSFWLTSSPVKTLSLRIPSWSSFFAIPAAALLAFVLFPLIGALGEVIKNLYPVREEMVSEIAKLSELIGRAPLWQVLLLMALLPAIFEELAFRGFILSGFRHLGHKWRAIIYAAVFFGITHSILQQSINACIMGIVIGFIVVQTNSIWPGMVFHFTNNALAMVSSRIMPRITPEFLEKWPVLKVLFVGGKEEYAFSWIAIAGGAYIGAAIIIWFALMSCPKSVEETIQEAIKKELAEDEREAATV